MDDAHVGMVGAQDVLACRVTLRSALCGGLVRCFDLMGAVKLGPGSATVVEAYHEVYGDEHYGTELARRGLLLGWGLNLAFAWVVVMAVTGFWLVLAGWQVVGVAVVLAPLGLALVLMGRLVSLRRAGEWPQGWG